MRRVVRALTTAVLVAAAARAVAAQPAQASAPALPALSPEAAIALEDLDPRYAGEAELIPGWFRNRPVLYHNFGAVPQPLVPGRLIWPIHGFDARGNPVAMRGQRPIFATIPGLADYSGIWRLEYLVVADNVQPNAVRTIDAAESLVRSRRAYVRTTEHLLNLPIVPRGTRLARDSAAGAAGWFQGRDVQFFDFGAVSADPAPMWRFALGPDVDGEPNVLTGQNSIVDSIPTAPTYPDLWAIRFVRVDSTYPPNSVTSAFALQRANLRTDSVSAVLNLPIVIFDGAPLARRSSPITEFADVRSPFPPAPTPQP